MRRSVGIRPLIVTATLLACLAIPEAALGQSGCFPMTCNDPNQSGPASSGQDIGGSDPVVDLDDDASNPPAPPGAPGAPGFNSADGADASGQRGSSSAGQAGQSGRPTPPAPPPAPSRSTRRSSSSSTARGTTTTSAVTTPTPDPLLEASPSPSPSPSPTPTESPSPTASPSDLVTALQDADPASNDGSMVPFFALVLGAILLVLYLRSRRPGRGRGTHSLGSRRGGGHSLR